MMFETKFRRKKNQLTDLVVDEISLVDNPANEGARIVLMKRNTESQGGEDDMSLNDIIAKSLVEDAGDTRRERDFKTIMKAQLKAGATTVEKIGAELSLEGHAAEIRKSDPSLSPEQAYVKAMDLYPDIAAIAVS